MDVAQENAELRENLSSLHVRKWHGYVVCADGNPWYNSSMAVLQVPILILAQNCTTGTACRKPIPSPVFPCPEWA